MNFDEQGNQILTFNTKEEYDAYMMQVNQQQPPMQQTMTLEQIQQMQSQQVIKEESPSKDEKWLIVW